MKHAAMWLALLSFVSPLVAANRLVRIDLVSDRNDALITDPSLVNPWGMPFPPTNGLWVANNGSSTATLYLGDVAGSPLRKSALHIDLPSSPAAVAVNRFGGFLVSGSPAVLVFATETGTIRAWQPALGTASVQVASKPNAVYTGLAMSDQYLYAANFRAGTIDVYDSTFTAVTLVGHFVDPALPSGYAPYNVIQVAGVVVVAYAVQDAAKHDPVPGAGNGIIDVFTPDGVFLNRFITSGGPLNAPWGMVLASPSIAGDGFLDEFLVANAGDGRINAFNGVTGAFLDVLRDTAGNPMVIDGLRGIAVGDSSTAGDVDALYFTAGPNGGAHGVFGKILGADPGSNPLIGSGAAVSMTEGEPATVTVATFSDTNPVGTWTAVINWGNASTSAAVLVPNGSGAYLVRGRHTYAEESAANAITITVNDTSDGDSATFSAVAAVADAPLSAMGTTIGYAPGRAFDGVVATFSDADPAGTAADYTATIDWGDGSVSTGVVAASGQSFIVTGAHTYAAGGLRTVTVTIADGGGATATATTTAFVGSVPTLSMAALLALAAVLAMVAVRRCG